MSSKPSTEAPEVTVVLPVLNEEQTLAQCLVATWTALKGAGISGEIVVADNGSTDRSAEIAAAGGARVVRVEAKGYGNALFSGCQAARGRFIVFLDADLSYEFAHIPRFVDELRQGADLVMGSRFRGTIHEGAMPWLHRHLGTPVLTAIANLFYKCGISDIMCGMRGLTREAFERLGLRSGGMEFASEMPIKAALLGLRISEIPTDLRPDGRDRPPHLRSFHDGWRHLRFLLLFCPNWLFLVPGLSAISLGLGVTVAILLDISPYVGVVTCLLGLSATVLGVQMTLLGLATRGFAQLRRLHVRETIVERCLVGLTLEKGLVVGLSLILTGGGILAVALTRIIRFMSEPGYDLGQIDLPSTKLALLSTTLLVTGVQIVFSSFFLGLFSIEPVTPQSTSTSMALNLDFAQRPAKEDRAEPR